MASAATALLPQQQQQGEVEASNSEAVSRSASSGSVGPFFAVMSILTVLAIISCVLGRICSRRRGRIIVESPLDSIKGRGCLGWLKRRCRRCMDGEVEAGAKVMACSEDRNNDVNNKAKDGTQVPDPPQV